MPVAEVITTDDIVGGVVSGGIIVNDREEELEIATGLPGVALATVVI
jgi:hypothetical protein